MTLAKSRVSSVSSFLMGPTSNHLSLQKKISEIRFKQGKLQKNKKILQLMLLLIAVLYALLIPVDMMILKQTGGALLFLPIKITFIVFCLFSFNQVNKIERFDVFERYYSLLAIIFFSVLLIGHMSYQADYYLASLFDVLIIVIFSSVTCISTKHHLYIGTSYVVLVLIVQVIFKDFNWLSLYIMLFAYACTQFISLVLSVRTQVCQRQEYLLRNKLKHRNHQLRQYAFVDTLTGVSNRRALESHIAKYIDQVDKGVYVVLADLDHFKNINDQFGHDIGDRVLKAFSDFVSSLIGENDGFYRVGGEEFVIVLEGYQVEKSQQCIEEIILRLSQVGLGVNALTSKVTASFGMVRLSQPEGFEKALSKADVALYQAKNAGRNQLITL